MVVCGEPTIGRRRACKKHATGAYVRRYDLAMGLLTERQEWAERLTMSLGNARNRARKMGLDFNLTRENMPLIPSHCPVLGIPIVVWGAEDLDNTASIDRINPALGYVIGNVRWISWRANNLRSDGTAEELRLVAEDAARLDAALKTCQEDSLASEASSAGRFRSRR